MADLPDQSERAIRGNATLQIYRISSRGDSHEFRGSRDFPYEHELPFHRERLRGREFPYLFCLRRT